MCAQHKSVQVFPVAANSFVAFTAANWRRLAGNDYLWSNRGYDRDNSLVKALAFWSERIVRAFWKEQWRFQT